MKNPEIGSLVLQFVRDWSASENLDKSGEAITPDTKIRDDLEVYDVTLTRFYIEFGQHFGLDLDDELTELCNQQHSVQDLATLIAGKQVKS